tara:strand:- start:756 stop:950 length:195 start_codon:yes stop_codon:yes gene_type:complete
MVLGILMVIIFLLKVCRKPGGDMVPRSHKVPLMAAEAVDKGERKEEESAKLRKFLQSPLIILNN